jgi:hypothetical protein
MRVNQRNVVPWSIWDFLAFMTATILIVEMSMQSYIPPGVGAFWLVAFVICRAIARARGCLTRCLGGVIWFVLYGPLILVLIWHGGYRNAVALFLNLLDHGAGTILGRILALFAGPFGVVVVLFVALCYAMSRWLALNFILNDRVRLFFFHTVFSILGPVIVVLTFMVSAPNRREAVLNLGMLVAAILILEAIYVLVFAGASATGRKN